MSTMFERVRLEMSAVGCDLRARFGRLRRDERGVSAVEFAMLLPLMVSLYLGAVEVSQGIGADRKVTLTARTVADLVSQVSSVSNSDMTNSLNAASAVISPFSSANLKVVVSSVKIDAQGNATVAWSDTLNGAARSKGSSVAVPAALKVPNSSLIWSEVTYTYTPVIGHFITGSINLSEQIYMRPRASDCVLREAQVTSCV
jgi:Flp pilus assembly protein TadG